MSLTTLAHAKAFREIESCGVAIVTEGTICSNAKVDFSFVGCKSNLVANSAKSVTCEGAAILAKYQSGDFRYEARFKKSEEAWGSTLWKLDGNIKQFQREISKDFAPLKKQNNLDEKEVIIIPADSEKNGVSAPSIATPILSTVEVSTFKFSSFADIRYTNFHVENNPLISSGHPESGFALEDAAFYANVLDLAVRRSRDYDTPRFLEC
jgi:hypothetical protein